MKNKAFSVYNLYKNITHHGALNYNELESLGITPETVLDFSSNINPFGPPHEILKALEDIKSKDISSYPDRDSSELRIALTQKLGVCKEQIVVGNGTAELIWLLAFTFVKPGDKVLILSPTFGEYERCIALMGGLVEHVKADSKDNFKFNIESINQALKELKPELCFICNPNNPTGSLIFVEQIGKLAKENPNTGFIIDEAYLSFLIKARSVINFALPNIIILRSMTKNFSIAGLRLGYAVGPKDLIAAISGVRPAWNVNRLAQIAGLTAIRQNDFIISSVNKIQSCKEKLVADLELLGYSIVPSSTHYFIMKVGNAKRFRSTLLKKYQIQVRDCSSFGIPSYVRISTQKQENNDRLIHAIKEMTV